MGLSTTKPPLRGLRLRLWLCREKAKDTPQGFGVRGLEELNRPMPTAAFGEHEEVLHLDFERLGELGEGGDGGAPLPAQNLREVPLGEVGLQVETVQGAVLLLNELPQPLSEILLETHRPWRLADFG